MLGSVHVLLARKVTVLMEQHDFVFKSLLGFIFENMGLISLIIVTYSGIVFSLFHADFLPVRINRVINAVAGILLGLIVLLVLLIPKGFSPRGKLIIAVVSILLAVFLQLIPIGRERRRAVRKFRIRTFRFFIPVMISFLVISVCCEKWIIEATSLFIMAMILIALWDGSLGARLLIEHQPLMGTRKTMTTGISIINHTIKNEMAKVQFLLSSMEEEIKGIENPLVAKWISTINDTSGHLAELNQRVKSMTYDIRVTKQHENISVVVDRAFEEFSSICSNLEEPIYLSLHKTHDFIMPIDKIQFQEVINNLLHNAIEAFSPAGGKQRYIKICVKEENFRAVLSIEDNGKGIPRELIKRIKEPFFTSKKGGRNFGLGLSYCQHIVELHGGKLDVKSVEGKGTTVSCSFPHRVIRTKQKLIN